MRHAAVVLIENALSDHFGVEACFFVSPVLACLPPSTDHVAIDLGVDLGLDFGGGLGGGRGQSACSSRGLGRLMVEEVELMSDSNIDDELQKDNTPLLSLLSRKEV